MKVGTRIYLSFSFFVGLLLAVAALNYVMTGILSQQVEANVSPSRTATALLGIDRDVARLSYLVHAGKNADPFYRRIMARLKELEEGNIPDQQRSVLGRMHWVLADHYWSKSGELVSVNAERQRLGETALPEMGERMRLRVADLVERAGKTGSATATRMASRAEETLLLTRLAILNYYTDPVNVDNRSEARRMLDQLQFAFEDLAQRPWDPRAGKIATSLVRDLPAFKDLFHQLEDVTHRKESLEDQMDRAVAENAQLAKQLGGDADRSLGALEDKVHSDSIDTRVLTLTLTLMAAVLAALAAHILGRRITRPLTAISDTIGRITKGEHNVPIPETASRDEIGDLARAATEIRELVAWSEAQRWTQSGLAELARTLQEAKTPQELSEAVVLTLSPKLNAGCAAIYLFDQSGRLEHMAGYGVNFDEATRPSFALGEALVGLCAAQQKAVYLDKVPPDYLRVRSGLGEHEPLYLALLPIAHLTMLHGVLEVATFHPLSSSQRVLLEEAMPLLALHFENLYRHQRTQELLEESQRQAEELQASEEELKAQSDEMHAVNERLSEQKRELEAANDAAARTAEQLAQASRHKSEFLANMSHELRTPLNSLLILSKDLAKNTRGNLDTEQIESAQVIHDAGTHLLGLINDILDLAKVEAGKLVVNRGDVDLGALVETVAKRFAPAAADKGLDFSVHVSETAPLDGWTDGKRVEQILHNLLSNAVKYTASGSIRLEMQGDGVDRQGERWISFHVTDTGSGIDAQDFERMFEAFERLDEQRSGASGGTGLGLAISRQLARLLGGDITVTSQPDHGSTFTLRLPVHSPHSISLDMARTERAPGRRRIVVIEDDHHFAAILCRRAEEKGFLCVHAPSGDTGMQAVRRERPAGVILDLGLPDMDGWQVIDAMKADPLLAEIPIYIISGSEPPKRYHEAAGFDIKPVSADRIALILGRIAATEDERERRVLLVDPDAPSRAATAALLGERGLKVVTADCGEQALKHLAEERFCCIVSELNLPDTGVVELLEVAQRRLDTLPAVIIFTDAEPTGEQALRLREFTDTVVLKGARAPQRLLDEVSLFLHTVSRSHRFSEESNGADPEAPFCDKTVLLVDDDMRNTFALSKVLRSKGLKVLLAQNGRKALAVLEQAKRVDAVLMDVMMPEMDGIEATRAIRSRPEWHGLPIIALTAKAMRGDRQRCLEAGADDYLAKPIDIDELLSRLRDRLGR